MPRMYGLEGLIEVKKNLKRHELPMLVLTAEKSADSIKQAKENGAIGVIITPFDPHKLISAIQWLTG